MASELTVDKISPNISDTVEIQKLSGTIPTGYRITGTDTGSIYAPGMIVAVHVIENSTRTTIADNTEYQFGVFTKKFANTYIQYQVLIHGYDQVDRDASGLYLAFESSNVQKFKERTLLRQDSIGTGNNEECAIWGLGHTTGLTYAEQITIYWGTDTASSSPFNTWNPNQSDESRFNGQRRSYVVVNEIVDFP
jgi:hypothetical protein